MNIGTIQKAANATNSTPKNDTIGCTRELAGIYNDLQRGKEEIANQKKIDEESLYNNSCPFRIRFAPMDYR